MTMRAIDWRFGNKRPFSGAGLLQGIPRFIALLGVAAIFASSATSAFAGPIINYGNFPGTTVNYNQVKEAANSAGDTAPLFFGPTVTGDSISFSPIGFSASASGAGGVDITDGNLNFDVAAHVNKNINSIQLSEAGDVTLSGFGTDATFAAATARVFVRIDEVNGVGINSITTSFAMNFAPSGGTFGLLSDGLGGPLYNDAWSGNLFVDLNAILAANSIAGKATKVNINLDNTLVAVSQAGTFALIAKKHLGGVSITVNGQNPGGGPDVPEPASMVLVSMALVGLALGGYRRQVAG